MPRLQGSSPAACNHAQSFNSRACRNYIAEIAPPKHGKAGVQQPRQAVVRL